MMKDEELIQTFEEKANSILEKAQQYLTTSLPGGPGVFAYVVVSNLVGKLFGNTKKYVENAVNQPVSIPNFIYVEPLDEELEEFFDDPQFASLRKEFPVKFENFTADDWMTMRRYYKPLYYSFYYREPFMTQMFSSEIQSQNYHQIIQDFELLPVYKQALDSVPSATRQHALWSAVSGILKETVDDVWKKDYAKEVFKDAKSHPEVSELIEKIKAKVKERVNLEQLKEWYDSVKDATGRSLQSPAGKISNVPMQTIECVTQVLPDGHVEIPSEMVARLSLPSGTSVRVLLFGHFVE